MLRFKLGKKDGVLSFTVWDETPDNYFAFNIYPDTSFNVVHATPEGRVKHTLKSSLTMFEDMMGGFPCFPKRTIN